MATGYNCPQTFVKAFDNDGNPAPGAKLYAFLAGSTIPKKLYYDYALTQPCPHPLVADSDGNFAQYFLEHGAYKLSLFDQDDNQLRPPEEPIFGSGYDPSPAPTPIVERASCSWSSAAFSEDPTGILWHGVNRAFRVDFLVKPFARLKHCGFFSTLYEAANYAIYGTENDFATSILLYEGSIPIGDIGEHDIDISSYSMISLVMEPDGIFQYVEQKTTYLSEFSSIPRLNAFHSGMVNHEPGTSFPAVIPDFLLSDPALIINKYCAVGLSY